MNSPEVKCSHAEMIRVEELKAHPQNPNQHPSTQIELLAKIIEHQGWRRPIRVSKLSGFITAGHGALLAARSKGWELVPVDFQDYESEKDELADLMADNRLAELAETDDEILKELLQSLDEDGFDITLAGFSFDDLDDMLEDEDQSGSISEESSSSEQGDLLKFDGLSIPLSSEEKEALRARADAHAETNGTYFGFASSLLDQSNV